MELDKKVLSSLCEEYHKYNHIDPKQYAKHSIARGLRNPDGTGIAIGITQICNVRGYIIDDGVRTPIPGKLYYRGISATDIVEGCRKDNRFGFEEVAWLLLFGSLPDAEKLKYFRNIIADQRELPHDFVEDMMLKRPAADIMNMLERSVIQLYSFDENADDLSLENVIRQSIGLIARMPTLMTYAYQVKRRQFDGKSMFLHPNNKEHSLAESILAAIRPDMKFTDEEAKLLDTCLMLHADHGGGNNSTFTVRCLTSTGTDTYSAIAGGLGSLKGPRHGGANHKVCEMLNYIKNGVKNPGDDGEVYDYLCKILNKEAGDRSGLVYGMGHAVYMLSDPRAQVLKNAAREMAEKRGGTALEEFKIIDAVERLTPEAFAECRKGVDKAMCANVDLYSGYVYSLLGIKPELFTPIFASARVVGWCAHRLEELSTESRIMRPAYWADKQNVEYIDLSDR